MLTDGLEWCGLLWCFYQTLILTAPIHCRASIAETLMQWCISTNLMKKQTHPNLGWPEDEHIYSTFSYLWPWTTKLVLNRWGIFVEIAKNTLYGSKFGHNHTSMESCINLNFKKLTLMTGFVVQGHICVNYFFNAITTKKRLSFFCGAQK